MAGRFARVEGHHLLQLLGPLGVGLGLRARREPGHCGIGPLVGFRHVVGLESTDGDYLRRLGRDFLTNHRSCFGRDVVLDVPVERTLHVDQLLSVLNWDIHTTEVRIRISLDD